MSDQLGSIDFLAHFQHFQTSHVTLTIHKKECSVCYRPQQQQTICTSPNLINEAFCMYAYILTLKVYLQDRNTRRHLHKGVGMVKVFCLLRNCNCNNNLNRRAENTNDQAQL